MRKIQTLFLYSFLAVLAAIPAAAQLTRGFISGTVQDASGAVIGGVKVVITETEKGLKNETVTNGLGVYRFVAVEPGTYNVEFSMEGFETKKIGGVIVNSSQEVVISPAMTVATTTITVDVVDAPPGVELAKATATIGNKLDQATIAALPLSGTRDVNNIALFTPTAIRAPGSSTIAANGQRARNNNFMIDGVDNNDVNVTIPNNRIIPESIAEFQVLVNPYSTEYGHSSGAQIMVITRSGTNALHGEAWDYYRANWMEPVSLLNKRQGITSTPRFDQNQAGGLIGGPVIKNRTFFFGLLETNRRRDAPDARNATAITIPTPKGYDVLASLPLRAASGSIPAQTAASRQAVLDALKFLPSIYPLITAYDSIRDVPINGVNVQTGTARIPLSNPSDFWTYQGRIDHRLSDRQNLSYRFQIDRRNQPDVVSNLGFGSKWSGGQTVFGQNHALSHTRTFGTRFVNEFRFSYVRRTLDFPENDPRSQTIGVSGFTIGGLNSFPQGRIQNTFQWQNVSTYLMGRHSLKFGADIRRTRLYNLSAFDSKGTWVFNSLQDFLNNVAFSRTLAVNAASFDARQTSQSYFFQDDIKVTHDLTMNFGIRYEVAGVPFGFFGATDPAIIATRVAGLVKTDRNNWAPRAGLAYSPTGTQGFLKTLLGDGQTVFRGGYGMGYDVLFFNILTNTAANYPRVVTRLENNLTDVFPVLPPRQATVGAFNPLTQFVFTPADTQAPTAHYYSFAIQRQVGKDYIFELGYTGSRSYHGIRQGQWNPGILNQDQAAAVLASKNQNAIPAVQARRLFPLWGSRLTLESTALSNYNALYFKVDKRLSRGLLVGGNWTWSANFSDNDESLGVADIVNSSPQIPQDYFNMKNEYGRSVFDRTHRFAFYYVYDIPWFKGPKALDYVFAGWKLTGGTDFQSGQPFTIRTGVDTGGTGTPTPHRPNLNPSGTLTLDPVTGNLRTFVSPLNGTGRWVTALGTNGLPLANSLVGGGNLGKNTLRGPGNVIWNFSVAKKFNLTERFKLQLRSDWLNGWNHRNFGNPVAAMSSTIFGTNTTDPGGRTMLVSAKILF